MRPTVHDIAEQAGVSLATVDRVLNRRPGVREQTRARVEEVVARLGFVRDVAAANLAKGRVYPLVFLIPAGENSFMQAIEAQVEEAIARSPMERTQIRLIKVPRFDASALASELRALAENPPAGVAVVAVDTPEVLAEIERLTRLGVAVVTLVSDIAGASRCHFSGIDNIAAGRTAGSLMGRFLAGRSGKVGVIAGSMLVGDHRDRLEGFRSRLRDINDRIDILDVVESHDAAEEVERLARDFIRSEPDLIGLYNLAAGDRGLVAALETVDGGKARPVTIAHELTPHTRAGLISGLIDAVLSQDAGHEVRSAVRVMMARSDGAPVIEAQERIRIDIFLKDNLP